jgi:hypothetical protein
MKTKPSLQSTNANNTAQSTGAVLALAPTTNGAIVALLPLSSNANVSPSGLTAPPSSSVSTLNDLKQRFEQVQLNSVSTTTSTQQTPQIYTQSINGTCSSSSSSSSQVNKAITQNKFSHMYMSHLTSNNIGGVCNSESSSPVHQTTYGQTNHHHHNHHQQQQQQPLSSLSFSSSSSSNFSLSPSSSSSWSSNSSSLSNVLLPSSLVSLPLNNSIGTISNFNATNTSNYSSGASTNTLNNNMTSQTQTIASAPTPRSCSSGSGSLASRHSSIHLNLNHTQLQQSSSHHQLQPSQRQSLQETDKYILSKPSTTVEQTTTNNSVLAAIAQIHKNAAAAAAGVSQQLTTGSVATVPNLQLKELTKTAIMNSAHSSNTNDKCKQPLVSSNLTNTVPQLHQSPSAQPVSLSPLSGGSMVPPVLKKLSATTPIAPSCAQTATTTVTMNKSNVSSSAHGCNWVPLRHHTAKCNIMLRKMRRGAKRSKSLPSSFK